MIHRIGPTLARIPPSNAACPAIRRHGTSRLSADCSTMIWDFLGRAESLIRFLPKQDSSNLRHPAHKCQHAPRRARPVHRGAPHVHQAIDRNRRRYGSSTVTVSDAEHQMKSLLRRLLASSSVEELEDYVSALHKVEQALERAREQGRLSQKKADMVLSNWLIGR